MSRITRWPARALGRDNSPLFRRADRIEAAIFAGLVAIFLITAPVLAAVAGRMIDAKDLREQHAERTWRRVPATVLGVASTPDGWESPALTARWTAPDGRRREGVIPVVSTVPAGQQLPIWVDSAGRQVGPPVDGARIDRDVAAAAIVASLALAGVLALAGGCVRIGVNRYRIAGWEASWNAVGPQWSRQP
jgi:hypothetical protein